MNFLKRLTLIGLSLTIAACASTQIEQQQYSSTQSEAEKQTTSVKTKRQQISIKSINISEPLFAGADKSLKALKLMTQPFA